MPFVFEPLGKTSSGDPEPFLKPFQLEDPPGPPGPATSAASSRRGDAARRPIPVGRSPSIASPPISPAFASVSRHALDIFWAFAKDPWGLDEPTPVVTARQVKGTSYIQRPGQVVIPLDPSCDAEVPLGSILYLGRDPVKDEYFGGFRLRELPSEGEGEGEAEERGVAGPAAGARTDDRLAPTTAEAMRAPLGATERLARGRVESSAARNRLEPRPRSGVEGDERGRSPVPLSSEGSGGKGTKRTRDHESSAAPGRSTGSQEAAHAEPAGGGQARRPRAEPPAEPGPGVALARPEAQGEHRASTSAAAIPTDESELWSNLPPPPPRKKAKRVSVGEAHPAAAAGSTGGGGAAAALAAGDALPMGVVGSPRRPDPRRAGRGSEGPKASKAAKAPSYALPSLFTEPKKPKSGLSPVKPAKKSALATGAAAAAALAPSGDAKAAAPRAPLSSPSPGPLSGVCLIFPPAPRDLASGPLVDRIVAAGGYVLMAEDGTWSDKDPSKVNRADRFPRPTDSEGFTVPSPSMVVVVTPKLEKVLVELGAGELRQEARRLAARELWQRLCPAFFKRPMDVLDAPDSLAIVRQEWVTEVLRRGSFFKPEPRHLLLCLSDALMPPRPKTSQTSLPTSNSNESIKAPGAAGAAAAGTTAAETPSSPASVLRPAAVGVAGGAEPEPGPGPEPPIAAIIPGSSAAAAAAAATQVPDGPDAWPLEPLPLPSGIPEGMVRPPMQVWREDCPDDGLGFRRMQDVIWDPLAAFQTMYILRVTHGRASDAHAWASLEEKTREFVVVYNRALERAQQLRAAGPAAAAGASGTGTGAGTGPPGSSVLSLRGLGADLGGVWADLGDLESYPAGIESDTAADLELEPGDQRCEHVGCQLSRSCIVAGLERHKALLEGAMVDRETRGFKTMAYDAAIAWVKEQARPIDISKVHEAVKTVSKIGERMGKHICDIISMGDTAEVRGDASDEGRHARARLEAVQGVGPERAKMLYLLGYRTVSDLQNAVRDPTWHLRQTPPIRARPDYLLKGITREYLIHFDEVTSKTSREEILSLRTGVRRVVRQLLLGALGEEVGGEAVRRTIVEPLGSFRRGALETSDMDVVVVLPEDLLPMLHASWCVAEDSEDLIRRHRSAGAAKPGQGPAAAAAGPMTSPGKDGKGPAAGPGEPVPGGGGPLSPIVRNKGISAKNRSVHNYALREMLLRVLEGLDVWEGVKVLTEKSDQGNMFGSGENLKWERIHVSTWIGMLRVPLSGKIRRVDVKIYPMRILPYAQIYFTGDVFVNRALRFRAMRHVADIAQATTHEPYTPSDYPSLYLGDHGLYPCTRYGGGQSVQTGPDLGCRSECDLFRMMGLPGFVPPIFRSQGFVTKMIQYLCSDEARKPEGMAA